MSEESPTFKIQYEYQNPTDVEAEVPGSQSMREVDPTTLDTSNEGITDGAVSNEVATNEDFTLQPVITVTKKEATLTKGDLKLQKVTVTEDIAVKYQHLFKKETKPGKTVVTSVQTFEYKY